ncbi:MAG: hypothetical protein GXP31_16550 [Kiritimatiellaeota bacterium]|nr:hypothetical protein [Kiritimatiellota bacterium]
MGEGTKKNQTASEGNRRTGRTADPGARSGRTRPKQKPKPPDTNPLEYLPVVLNRCFPDFWEQVDVLPDFRDPNRTWYSLRHLVGLGLLMMLSLPGSRTAFEAERRKGKTAQNLGKLIDEPCDQTATTWTLDYLLRGMEPSGLADVRTGMLRSLIKARRLEDCRLGGEYLVAVDGTELHRFKDRHSPHCPECLKQTHANGTTDYFHSVLEAKLVTRAGLALSMASEFIENGGAEYDKQDCELKAFYRLAPELKQMFPRLPICLLLDSLYANETLLDICLENSWSFYVGFKEGSIPNLYRQMQDKMAKHPEQVLDGEDDNEKFVCRWACNLTYRRHTLHAVMYDATAKKDGKKTRFVFLTDHRPDAGRVREMINMGGRQRGKIENQGFNVQKNCGYELEKAYGFRDHALKNYYLLVQIAHCLHQLMMHTDVNAKLMQEEDRHRFPKAKTGLQAFKSLKNLAKAIGEHLRHVYLRPEILDRDFARGIQLRFVFDTS